MYAVTRARYIIMTCRNRTGEKVYVCIFYSDSSAKYYTEVTVLSDHVH